MTINKEIEEAMKLVAGFMGFNWNKRSHKGSSVLIKEENGDLKGFDISQPLSLDRLIPVWEKLNEVGLSVGIDILDGFSFWLYDHHQKSTDFGPVEARGKTIPQAAWLATAKAIEEIRENK